MNEPEQVEEGASSGFGHYLHIALHRRWWLAISAITSWALALALSLVLPPKYKSDTLVFIEQQAVPAQYVTPNTTDLQQRMQSLTEQILRRDRLLRIMDEFHLYGKQPNQTASDQLLQRMRDDTEVKIIKPEGQAEVSAFKISYSAENPALAQKVAGRLTSLFIEDSLRNQQHLSEDTTSFLESQLIQARKDLDQQESLLREFRSKYLGELPEQMSGNVQILLGLQNRLQSATESLHQAEQQRLYLQSLIGQSVSISTTGGGAASLSQTPLDEQIAKMKADLAYLSPHYRPLHPDVVHLKEQIATAEKIKREMESSPNSAKKTAEPDGVAVGLRGRQVVSPISQLQSQLKANELEIANRKEEIKDLDAQIAQYQARLNLTPMREQELAAVTRNYQQSRANYDSLLTKKMQSEMASDLSKRQQGQQFRTIDPPSLPQRPYWPNPLKFAMIGFVAGTLLGCVGIVLMETLDARVYSEADLKTSVPVPVVATIPPLPTTSEQRQQRVLRVVEIAMASVMATSVPIITVLVYFKS